MAPAYRTAIFDCDGVIFDSNGVKTRAFAETVQQETKEAVDEFVRFHAARGGISRFEKFTWFYRDYLKRKNWSEEVDAAAERFAKLVRQGLLNAPEVPGVVEALKYFGRGGVRCYVISGGEQDEVQRLLSVRDLGGYFEAVLGSPTSKIEHLERLKGGGELSSSGILFGDAKTDLEGAEALGLEFVFIFGFTTWTDGAEVCRARRHTVVRDFKEWLAALP